MPLIVHAFIAIASVIGAMLVFSLGVVVIAVISLAVVLFVIVTGFRPVSWKAGFYRKEEVKREEKRDTHPKHLVIDAEYEVIEEKGPGQPR